jgi:arsenate reductase-like glutaredoxin family protein
MISDISINGPAGSAVTLGKIETQCAELDSADKEMRGLVEQLEADLAEVKQKHLPRLKRQAAIVARTEADLHSLIERAPKLFERPRTITLHGIKVGFSLAEGKLTWNCEDETLLARIKNQYGKLAVDFIQAKESVRKDALKDLDAKSLAKLGCTITGAGDQVVLKRVDSDIEKLMDKLTQKLVEVLTAAE